MRASYLSDVIPSLVGWDLPGTSQKSPPHDEVIKCKHFPRYWPFVRGIHRSGEFPAQRPVTRGFDVFFDLCPNKRLNKQLWGCWFETPSSPLWRHCNGFPVHGVVVCTTDVQGVSYDSLPAIIQSEGNTMRNFSYWAFRLVNDDTVWQTIQSNIIT